MKFVNGFKALINNRTFNESGAFVQTIMAVESGNTTVGVKYVKDGGTAIDPKNFKLIYGKYRLESGKVVGTDLYGVESGTIPTGNDVKFTVKDIVNGKTIIE